MAADTVYIRRFGDFGIADVPTVGGKTAGLGEMYRSLSGEGVRVPDGFAITADAYRHTLEAAGALGSLHEALDGLDPEDLDDLARRAKRARDIVYEAGLRRDLPPRSWTAIGACRPSTGRTSASAVRSSATAEDLPTASFAGQQETFLDIQGEKSCSTPVEGVSPACSRTGRRLPRSTRVRPIQGGAVDRGHEDGPFGPRLLGRDVHPRHRVGLRDVVFITGAYGLGENIVQGAVDPDEFYVHKPTLARATGPCSAGGSATRR